MIIFRRTKNIVRKSRQMYNDIVGKLWSEGFNPRGQYAVTKSINVRPRARGRVGVVWSSLWVIKRKQRELNALAANLILLIYAFNCALCILHCALSNDDFRGFGALTADVEAGNEVVAVDAHAVEVV